MNLMSMSALERRLLVDELLARYVRCIDDDELERWPGFFTSAGRYIVRSRENAARGLPTAAIYCDSRGMLADRIVALRHANIFEAHRYRHLLGGLLIEAVSPDSLAASCNYPVLRTRGNGVTDVFSAGVYQDRIVVEEGQLLFAEKLVVFDTDRIDTQLVTPL